MKKTITLVITILLLFSCFCVPTFAITDVLEESIEISSLDPDMEIKFSADYKTLYFGSEKYVSYPLDNVTNEVYYDMLNEITLTQNQQTEVINISLASCEEGVIIKAIIKFTDGSYLTVDYIKEEYIKELENLQTTGSTEYKIDFAFPSNNIVTVNRENLYGQATIINNPMDIMETFDVETTTKDKKVKICLGYLIIYNDEYYYYDFKSDNTTYVDAVIYNSKSLNVYKITDQNTISVISEAENLYYSDEFGYLLNDNFTEKIANGFIILIFAIIPFIAVILFIMFAIKSKGIYRKLNIVTSAFLSVELIIFIIITILVK